MTTVTQTPLWM